LFALKEIEKEFLFGTYMKELRNEVEVLSTLDHPHIVRTLETFENREMMYLVMEYCSGGDLWKRINNLTERDVANIMSQVLSAVAFCHQHKVVHRDIKLENVLYETDAVDAPVKLIDFGLSQMYKRARDEYTMKLQVGTAYTLSPELIEGEYNEKTDVWSCGVVAYMLLSKGSRPFDAPEKKDVPSKIKEGAYTMDGPEWDGVSEQAQEFVASLMEYDTEKRLLAEEALQSPWLQQNIKDSQQHEELQPLDEPEPEVMESVQEALLHVGEEPQLKRLAKMIIAHCAPAHKLQDPRQAFEAFDNTHDGTISYREFQQTLSETKWDLSNQQIREIFSELDQNETGVINYTEFLSATLETTTETIIDNELIEEAFEKLDVDHSGAITKEGLGEVFESKHSDAVGEDIAEEMIAEVDTKQQDKISYDEFKEMFNNKEGGLEK